MKAKEQSERVDESLPVDIFTKSGTDIIPDNYEPDFVIPSHPIAEGFFVPEVYKSPLVLAGPRNKRRKVNI